MLINTNRKFLTLRKIISIQLTIAIFISSLCLTGCDHGFGLRSTILCNHGDGNIDLARQALEEGANINKLDYSTLNAESHTLTFAYSQSKLRQDMLYYLISEGADVNYCSSKTKAPLITCSAYSANYQLTSLLIEKGADVNLYGNGSSALTYSVGSPVSTVYERRQIQVFNLLLENGAEFSDETMKEAVEAGKEGKLLLLQTVTRAAVQKDFSTGLSKITECAILGDSEGVVDNFSNFEKLDDDERKLCICACAAFCNADVIARLKESNVDFTQEYFTYGGYIYLISCAYGNMNALEYVYENGLYPDDAFASEDIYTDDIYYASPDTLKYLIECGLSVNKECMNNAVENLDNEMLSFYFFEDLVSEEDYMSMIQELDELCNRFSPSPYYKNDDYGWLDTVRIVLDNLDCGYENIINCVFFAPDLEYCRVLVEEYGRTVKFDYDKIADNGLSETADLEKCAQGLLAVYQSPECIEYFLSKGADVNEDDGSHTVLYYAMKYGFYDSCKLLLENGADPNLKVTKKMNPAFEVCLDDDCNVGGSEHLFNLLLQYDIDFKSKLYYNGTTAYEYAEEYGVQERADAIKKYS